MRRLAALLAAGLFLAVAPAALAQPDAAVQWNRTTLSLLRTKGAQPATVHATRTLAIVHAAIYDAVNSVDRVGAPYLLRVRAPRRASAAAAADAAAHDTLVALFPAQAATIDSAEATQLAEVHGRFRREAGVRVGEAVARAILADRAGDGSAATPPAIPPGTAPGAYRPDPPMFAAPVFTHWPSVRPFVLRRGDQFRVGPPPALTSRAYAAALNEVQSLGKSDSTARTADQTQAAQFWAAPIWNYWNEIAQTAALAHHDSLADDAALFARLDLGFADGVIAFYDSKYHWLVWRPVTAIQLADTDGNPATIGDSQWLPLANTPADPSYPGAHSVISTIGADVLGATFGDRFSFAVTSEVLPGVTRSFDRFSAAAVDAGLSRIYAGVHTRPDHVAGQRLGNDVAAYVLTHALGGGRGER
jgi:hypothetical protein